MPSQEDVVPFSLCVAVSKIHDEAALRDLVESYVTPMRALGGRAWQPEAGPAPWPIVVFAATGGTESLILRAVPAVAREPALLVAHPGHNSLPAALEALARLRQLGVRARIHYLRGPADREGWEQLARALHDRAVRRMLCESRLGLVGAPSDWLVASCPAPEIIRSVWGPTVVPLPVDLVLSEPDAEVASFGQQLSQEVRARAVALVEPAEADLRAAGHVYALLRRVVDAERLEALAVRCFDLVLRRKTTGCLALAELNDRGVIAGCEGDLVATVAMLWVRRMFGVTPWMANPARLDVDRGVLSLAHCTVPRGACGPYRLRSHFESGVGVAVQGAMPLGPVTLVRIGGARMERLRVLDGELLCNTDHADLCRTQVEVSVGRPALQGLLDDPLGNHLVMIPGHRSAELVRWHEAMIG